MSETTGDRTYWMAWGGLLGITLVMVFFTNVPVVVGGIAAKAFIIATWFMHLKYEKWGLVACIILGTVATTLLLFGLIVPDGLAS